MATIAQQQVTADKLISAIVRYNNKDNQDRMFDIIADVNIQGDTVFSFDNGEIKKVVDVDEDIMPRIATFSSYGNHNLNMSVNDVNSTEASEILSAIYAFISDVKNTVSTNPIKA